jgi:hypothetical protein
MMFDSGSLNSNYYWGETKNSALCLFNKSLALSIDITFVLCSQCVFFSFQEMRLVV